MQEMVAGQRTDARLLEKVDEVYIWLESQIRRNGILAGACKACGDCCDFSAFDHRLFVTSPEMIYLAARLGADNIKTMSSGRCPYNIDGKCVIHQNRFVGCRIFCCKGDADFQSDLSESVLKKLKSICNEFEIPYRYLDLAAALNTFDGD